MRPPTGSVPLVLAIGGMALLAGGILLWRVAMPLDLALFDALRLGRQDGAVPWAWWLSRLGGFSVLGPLALVIAAGLVLRGRGADALWLFVTIVAGRLLVEGMKELVQRPRPPVPDPLALVTSYAFPSSHSAGSLLTAAVLAMLVVRRRAISSLMIVAALAVGWSRVALGVHWPSDVIAGWGIGLICAGIASRWLPGDPGSRNGIRTSR